MRSSTPCTESDSTERHSDSNLPTLCPHPFCPNSAHSIFTLLTSRPTPPPSSSSSSNAEIDRRRPAVPPSSTANSPSNPVRVRSIGVWNSRDCAGAVADRQRRASVGKEEGERWAKMQRSSSGGRVQKVAGVSREATVGKSESSARKPKSGREQKSAGPHAASRFPFNLSATILLALLLLWMLSASRILLRPTRISSTLRTTAALSRRSLSSTFAHRPSLSPVSHRQFALVNHQQQQSRHLHNIMTIDPATAYEPNAPSPFIVNKEPALEHLLAGYERVPAAEGRPAYAEFKGELEQSPNDDRKYR